MASAATDAGETTSEKEEYQRSINRNGRFVNPWPTWSRPTLLDVVKWRWNRTGIEPVPPEDVLSEKLPVIQTDLNLLQNPPRDKIQIAWIGHASLLVQMDGFNILTDPIFAERCSPVSFLGPKRIRPAPFKVTELPKLDLVVISHSHYDHLSLPDVKAIGNQPLWAVPLGLKQLMNQAGIDNVVELDWWQEHPLEEKKEERGDLKATNKPLVAAVPAQHWGKRSAFDDFKALWCGFVVVTPNFKFYYTGDTGYCSVFTQIGKKYGPIDLSAIPIGCYAPRYFMKSQHTDPEDAVKIHLDVQSVKSVGVHWGTFLLGDDPCLEPPVKLAEATREKGLNESQFFVTKHGEVRILE